MDEISHLQDVIQMDHQREIDLIRERKVFNKTIKDLKEEIVKLKKEIQYIQTFFKAH